MKAAILILFGVGIAFAISKILSAKRDAEIKRKRDVLSAVQVTNDITQVGKGGVLKLPPFGPQRRTAG